MEVDYLTKECGEKDKLVARLREELSVLKSSIGSLQNKYLDERCQLFQEELHRLYTVHRYTEYCIIAVVFFRNSELKNMLDKREEELVILRCANPDEAEEYQRTQASAQRAISVLNDRIEQKECLIAKYQGLLKELRDEARAAADKHQKDLDRVQKEHDFKVNCLHRGDICTRKWNITARAWQKLLLKSEQANSQCDLTAPKMSDVLPETDFLAARF